MLTGKKNSDIEHNYDLKVWNKFEIETMKDCHYLYLKCDVLLLAHVFEKFRNNSLKNYGSCPSNYLSTPALRWDAVLNIPETYYIFFEKGTRGGVSRISNRYSRANNKYLKSYDP